MAFASGSGSLGDIGGIDALEASDVPPFQVQQLVPLVFLENDKVPDSGLSLVGFRTEGSSSGGAGASGKPQTPASAYVTCSRASGSEMYAGCSDGTLLRYALQADGPEGPECYTLLSRQTLPTGKAIEQIVICMSIGRALILSDHQIHFYILPSLDPVSHSIIRPIRNVISLCVDEQHTRLAAPPDQYTKVEPVEFCVIKRTNIAMYTLKERLVLQREIPNGLNIWYGVRMGRYLCAADTENYDMIDLVASTSIPLLPFNQVPSPESTNNIIRPLVVVISEEEFLLISSMGASAMGVFITGNGDPVRGTLEWRSYPRSICFEYPYVVALLPDESIEIHSIETQAIVQVIPGPSTPTHGGVHTLVPAPNAFFVPSAQRTEKLRLVPVPLSSTSSSSPPSPTSPSSPSSPALKPIPMTFEQSNILLISDNSIQALLPATLLSQADALLESRRVEDAIDLADQSQRKLLVGGGGGGGSRLGFGSSNNNNSGSPSPSTSLPEAQEEVRYVYQRAGFMCFGETRFEEAGRYLLTGETDPRLVTKWFPELSGGLFRPRKRRQGKDGGLEREEEMGEFVQVFAGVASHLPKPKSVDEIVLVNLVKNYSPYLHPESKDAESERPTAELRRVLNVCGRDMLTGYLRKFRTRRLVGSYGSSFQHLQKQKGGQQKEREGGRSVNEVVDTVLAKILAETDSDIRELYTLVDGPNDIVLEEVEETFEKNGQFGALCRLYEKANMKELEIKGGNSKLVVGMYEEKLLEAWAKLSEGVWTDEDIRDPIERMIELLNKTSDRTRVHRWALWLMGRDGELGLKLIVGRDPKRSVPGQEELALLEKIKEASPLAGAKYLEYLVLQKRSQDANLHTQLVDICVDELIKHVADENTSKLWRAKASSYASTPTTTPFLLYFATSTPASPSRDSRLRTALLLQGSRLYDAERVLAKLEPYERIMKIEKAILFGKLGRHVDALTTLVREVHDPTSAEAYCMLGVGTDGGEVVSSKVASAIAERCSSGASSTTVTGMGQWATFVVISSSSSTTLTTKRTIDEETRKGLLKILLGVYMSGSGVGPNKEKGDEGALIGVVKGDGEKEEDEKEEEKRRLATTRLLNSQAGKFDVVDVINLLPPTWPLRTTSSFFARSFFRKAVHARNEGGIVKALSAAQNRETVEKAWVVLREQGAVIEEEEREGSSIDGDDEKRLIYVNEKDSSQGLAVSLDEKAPLREGMKMRGEEEEEED